MKKNQKQYLEKATYSHPQIGGYLTLKQFMLIEQDGKRCLILRYANEADFVIDRAELVIKQLDESGKVIGSINVKYDDISIAPGEMYAPESGLVVEAECVDFAVQMVYVAAGPYKYVFKNGRVTAYYEVLEKTKKRSAKDRSKTIVRRKFSGRGRFYGLLTLLVFVLIIGTFIGVVYDTYKPEEEETESNVVIVETLGNGGAIFYPAVTDGVYYDTSSQYYPYYNFQNGFEVSTIK